MIRINSIFGYVVIFALLAYGGFFGYRTQYLLKPPSAITVSISRSLLDNPGEWKMGSVELILTNEKRGLEIQRYGGAGSIQVRKDSELVPTLDKSMNMFFSSNNQNYLDAAINQWLVETAGEREAALVREIELAS